MSGNLPNEISPSNATVTLSTAQGKVHVLAPNASMFPKACAQVVSVPRDHHNSAAQASLDAGPRMQRRFHPFMGSLLRRQLSASVAVRPAPGVVAVEAAGTPRHLQQSGDSNAIPIQLGHNSEVRVLKTSGGTMTVRSLDAPLIQQMSPLTVKAVEGGRSTDTNMYRVTSSGTFVPYSVQSKGKEKSAGPQLEKLLVSPATPASAKVIPNSANKPENGSVHVSRLKFPDNIAASEVHPSKKNMAVVHPQVRPKPLVLPNDVVKDTCVSKTTVQRPIVALGQQRLSGVIGPEAAAVSKNTVSQPDAITLGPSKATAPKPAVENTERESARKSRVILVDLTDTPTDANQESCVTRQSSCGDGDVEVISPVVTEEALPRDIGCLQVPSGLKVDFINLDDLLIKDLNYLVKYFGESILEPLSMDDIANKGLSEWIDISNEAEVQRTFLELEALNGSAGQQSWTRKDGLEGSDVAYPIVVPDFEDMETSSPAVCQESSVAAQPMVVAASRVSGGLKDPPGKSPLILIIKKGANSSGSSPAWQLSAYRKSTEEESGESKALFLKGLDLYPQSGEQLKKIRKGRSARSLAVLKDKVMTDYLKNHLVPLHRVQGMYRYLFKKGHLKEGKLTYACEVYRNLRSRESRQRPVMMSLYEADDFSKKGSSTPGLLWHLKPKQTCSKYEYDEDYIPRKSLAATSTKVRRNLWGRPRVHWRSAARNSALQHISDTSDAPPYRLEQGNWTPKCTDRTKDWDIWVSLNSRESKMAHPMPMVLLRRVDEADKSPLQLPTPVTELYCEQCSYSCLNKAALNNHFLEEHVGLSISFKEVVRSCRPRRTSLFAHQGGET